MKREEVYEIVDSELDYHEVRWCGIIEDENKSIAEWLIYIESHLNKAKQEVYNLEPSRALQEVRKLTSLGFRTMMNHDTDKRLPKNTRR